jgi:hypothetical protein
MGRTEAASSEGIEPQRAPFDKLRAGKGRKEKKKLFRRRCTPMDTDVMLLFPLWQRG